MTSKRDTAIEVEQAAEDVAARKAGTKPRVVVVPWYTDVGSVAEFGRVLEASGVFRGRGEVLDYVEKPWKWQPERLAWVVAGRPGEMTEEALAAAANEEPA